MLTCWCGGRCFDMKKVFIIRARFHETRSELKSVLNLKPPKIRSVYMAISLRQHPNHSKILMHMRTWKLLINAGLTDEKQMLR